HHFFLHFLHLFHHITHVSTFHGKRLLKILFVFLMSSSNIHRLARLPSSSYDKSSSYIVKRMLPLFSVNHVFLTGHHRQVFLLLLLVGLVLFHHPVQDQFVLGCYYIHSVIHTSHYPVLG